MLQSCLVTSAELIYPTLLTILLFYSKSIPTFIPEVSIMYANHLLYKLYLTEELPAKSSSQMERFKTFKLPPKRDALPSCPYLVFIINTLSSVIFFPGIPMLFSNEFLFFKFSFPDMNISKFLSLLPDHKSSI